MDTLNNYPIAPSLIESINDENVSSFGEIAETILDISLEEGILRDIPIFNLFIKGYGFVANFRDRLFLKKLALFLKNSSTISQEEKENFLNKMNSESSFKQKVGENLLLLLERHNNFNKSALLGKIFASFIKTVINYEQLNRFANALDYLISNDIVTLIDENSFISEDFLVRLHHLDLAKMVLHTGNTGEMNRRIRRRNDPDTPELIYEINELGELFIKILRTT